MSNLQIIFLPVVASVGTILYVLVSDWAETCVLKNRRAASSFGNIILGLCAIMASMTTIPLFIYSPTHGLSGGILLIGIACLVMGDRFIYYPDNPPVPVTLEKKNEDVQ